MTRSEILENRQKWIEYLKRPETKKVTERLQSREDPEARCCLGHGCYVLFGASEDGFWFGDDEDAPEEFMDVVGVS